MKPTRITPLTLLACLCAAFLLTTGCKEPKEPDPQPCTDCPGCLDCPEPPDCSECPDCTGCPELPSPQEMIIGTWKLTSYTYTSSVCSECNKTNFIMEPKDCAECYVLIFNEDGTFSGTSSTNKFAGEYTIGPFRNTYFSQITVNDRTKETEYFDGRFYIDYLSGPYYVAVADNELQLSCMPTIAQWYFSYKRIEPLKDPTPSPPPVETPELAYSRTILHGCIGDPVSDKKSSDNYKFPENPKESDKLDISIENDSLHFVVGLNYAYGAPFHTECRIENDTIYISICDNVCPFCDMDDWQVWYPYPSACLYDCNNCDCYVYCYNEFEFVFRIKEYQNFAYKISLTESDDGKFKILYKEDIETYLLTK